MTNKFLIAITGGIGCGKSLISTILAICGYDVYDCDSNAKRLMDNDSDIKSAISARIDKSVISSTGDIDRTKLASIVFNNTDKLSALNSIVHSSVKKDILKWYEEKFPTNQPLFIETAILYQSGLDKIVDEVWEVTASEETRIKRVIVRNNFTREQVISRINSQKHTPNTIHPNTKLIFNENDAPILPQIFTLLKESQ